MLRQCLRAVGIATLLLSAFALGPALTATALSVPPRGGVFIDNVGLRLVDPTTGEELWRAEGKSNLSAVATASDGRGYVSVIDTAGSSTNVYTISPGSENVELIARVSTLALLGTVAAEGDELYLLQIPPPAQDGRIGSPTGVRRVPLSGRVEEALPRPTAARDMGYGVLSPNGQRWYRLVPPEPNEEVRTGFEMLVLTFQGRGAPIRSSLPFPGLSGYHSLLLSPDGRRVYVVDYYAQAIQVVDTAELAVVKVIGFGRDLTKRPSCAAALSPQGRHLYVLANHGPTNAGDGVLVYETASWRLVGHYLPGQDLYCLSVSPDGRRLYAVATASAPSPKDPSLVTIDTETGHKLRTVPLNLGDCCVRLGQAIGSAQTAEGLAEPPNLEFTLRVHDDRGNDYRPWSGGGNGEPTKGACDWRLSFACAPKLDPTSRQLSIAVDEVRSAEYDAGQHLLVTSLVDRGPWTFAIALP